MWSSGGLQTVLQENLNKHVRDQEVRATTSKVNGLMARWHNILFRGDLQKYGRQPPVGASVEASFGRDLDLESMFFASSKITTDLPLSDVLGDNAWQTWTSQTIKRSYSELNLMLQSYQKRCRAMVAKSWKSGLLPLKEVVLISEVVKPPVPPVAVKAYYTLWNSDCAVLVWPVVRDGMHCALDPEKAPEYVVITDVTQAKVIPTAGASPLRCMIQQRADARVKHIGCEIFIKGVGTPLLAWQRSKGFAQVSGAVLRNLAGEEGVAPLPAECITTGEAEDRIVVQLTLKHQPKISPEELTELLHARAGKEDALQSLEEIDESMLDEVMDKKERKEAVERHDDAKKQAVKFHRRALNIRKLVKKLIPHIGKSKPLRKKDPAVVRSIATIRKNHKGPNNVWKNWANPDTAPIIRLMPEGSHVVKDIKWQRFLITHQDVSGALKSFAWNRRGVASATACCLKQMWAWEQQVYGTDCPLPQDLLELAI
jgi:hypothetical protein